MPARNKKQILDALFDEPGSEPKSYNKAHAKAKELLFDSGIRLKKDDLAARRLWQEYQNSKKPRKKYYLIPAVAAAAVALAIGILHLPQTPAETKVVKQGISRSNFSEDFERAVQLYVRRTENFSVEHRNAGLHLAADTLTARIDFTATQTIKTVSIRTPKVLFEIIGTKIALDVNPAKAKLYVSEGKVKVSYPGNTEIVGEGGVWEYSGEKINRGTAGETDEELFERLRDNLQKPSRTNRPRKAPAQMIRITLNDGTELSGRLIRENKQEVVISVALSGSQELVLKRENIRNLRKEGGGH